MKYGGRPTLRLYRPQKHIPEGKGVPKRTIMTHKLLLPPKQRPRQSRTLLLYIPREKPTLHGRFAYRSRSFSPPFTNNQPTCHGAEPTCFALFYNGFGTQMCDYKKYAKPVRATGPAGIKKAFCSSPRSGFLEEAGVQGQSPARPPGARQQWSVLNLANYFTPHLTVTNQHLMALPPEFLLFLTFEKVAPANPYSKSLI